jgi:ABC-type branched-subunit amino acid transport system ATPase component
MHKINVLFLGEFSDQLWPCIKHKIVSAMTRLSHAIEISVTVSKNVPSHHNFYISGFRLFDY